VCHMMCVSCVDVCIVALDLKDPGQPDACVSVCVSVCGCMT